MLNRVLIAVFLFASSDLAWSQEPPKAPQIEPKQQPESGLKAQENHNQQATPSIQPLPGIPEVSAEGADRKSQNKPEEGSEQGTEFWPPLYGYRLKVTDTLLVGITFLLFVATLALWLATRRLVRSAEKTAERQLRAYVSIDGAAIMNVASGQTPKAVIDFKNFGQTPAYNVTHWQVITKPQIFHQSDDPFRLPPADLYRSNAIIGPTSGMKMCSTANRHLTDEEFTGLADGTLAMYVFGEIRYRDAFGEDRFMRYRRMLGGHTGVEGNRLAATQYPDEAN